MSLEVTTNIASVAAQVRRLGELQFLDAYLDLALEQTEDAFARGASPHDGGWRPLARSTLARKRGRGVLEETGALRSSITVERHGDEASLGSSLRYAGPNQRTRPFLDARIDEAAWSRAVARLVLKELS